jgi:hypothetical protein
MPFASKRPALKLTEDELKQLNNVAKSRTQPKSAAERSKILLKFHEGKSISQIARDLDTNEHAQYYD